MGDFFSNLFSGTGDALFGQSSNAAMDSIAGLSPEQLNMIDFSQFSPGELGTDPGLLYQFGNTSGNMFSSLGNQDTTNLLGLGLKGFGAYNAYQGQKQANNIANRQMTMSEDAYKRNVEADERRKALRFV